MNQGTKGQFKVGRLVATTIKLGGTLISVTGDQINTIASITKPLNFVTVIDCSANPNYPAADAGDVYKVSVAGKIGGGSGEDVQIGDDLLCITTAVAGTQAAVGSSWTILQGNVKSTADVPASTNKNYVTDAQAVVIGNTSGTNTGDNVEVAAQAVGFTITKGTTPKTLTVALDASVAGTNTGDSASDPAGSAAAAQAAAEASVAALNPLAGLASGYKLARSATPAAVTGTLDVDTGLASVVSISVTPASDLDGDTFAGVSASIEGGAGHVLIKCWKVTADGDVTFIAANAAKNVHWLAVGT